MVKETHNYGGLFFTSIALPWLNLFLFKQYNYLYKFILVCIVLYFANLGSLLPDIDKRSSYISKRIPLVSKMFYKKCKHRGFTHSLLFTFLLIFILDIILKNSEYNIVLLSASIGLIIGYISHLILDLFTKEGIEMFYPCKIKFYLLKIKPNSKTEKSISKLLLTIGMIGMFFNLLLIFDLY